MVEEQIDFDAMEEDMFNPSSRPSSAGFLELLSIDTL